MESFDLLVFQYAPMIHKIIHTLHIYKNTDEFYQIGLIGLWEASQSFHLDKGDFTSYAYKYIKGRLLTELTRANKHEDHILYPKDEYWEMLDDENSANPCELELLLTYCRELTEKQTKWITYTFLEDLSVKEIAVREHVSVSAVKQWRKGAINGVRHYLMHVGEK